MALIDVYGGGPEDPKPAANRLNYQQIQAWNQYMKSNPKGQLDELYAGYHKKGKVPIPYDSLRNELELLSQHVKGMEMKREMPNAENAHTGYQFPEMINEGQSAGPVNGNFLTQGTSAPAGAGMKFKPIPSDVKDLQWDAEKNLPYYIDPQTGDLTYTQPEAIYSKRFRKNYNFGGNTDGLRAMIK